MRALVTGATGLVGAAICERLAADGWEVRALVRDPARARWLSALGVAPQAGDVLDAAAFTAAAGGHDVLFHCAAAITPRGGWEAFRRPNLDGTANAIAAAADAGARLMHVSSVAVYGPHARYRPDGGRVSERDPLAPLPDDAHYARSKRESEAMVMQAHEAGRLWATAIRPCVVYGRRDRQFVPRMARMLRFGVAPVLGGGRSVLPVVHAANVADAAVRAATTDAAGGRAYNTANDDVVTWRDFMRLAGEGLGRRVRFVPVPTSLLVGAVAAARLVGGRGRHGNALTMASASVDFLTKDNPFDSSRAYEELGWTPVVRHADGVRDAFRWWKEHGSFQG